MHPRVMQIIDFYIGIPLCFLLSLLKNDNFLLNLKKGKEIKKILFLEMSEMGAVVLSYPLIRAVKEKYPLADIYFLTFAENREVLKLVDLIPEKNILSVRSGSILNFVLDNIKLIKKLKKLKIDLAFDLEIFARYTKIFLYFINAENRIGFYDPEKLSAYTGNLLNVRVNYRPNLHISQNYLNMYNLCCGLPEITNYSVDNLNRLELNAPVQEIETVREKLKSINSEIANDTKFIIVNPGASKKIPIRKWPVKNYVGLISLLRQKLPNYFIVIIGAKNDKKEAVEIKNFFSTDVKIIDFTERTSLNDLIGLFSLAEIIITNDSGPAHFASVTNIKIVDIFGPETPTLYCPLGNNVSVMHSNYGCSPCVTAYNQKHTKCKTAKCLESISVESVFQVVLNLLSYV